MAIAALVMKTYRLTLILMNLPLLKFVVIAAAVAPSLTGSGLFSISGGIELFFLTWKICFSGTS